jgi:putative transposase
VVCTGRATTLFAALNLVDGSVRWRNAKSSHRHQEFLSFLHHIEANVPAELDIHLVADNMPHTSTPQVRAWIATLGVSLPGRVR